MLILTYILTALAYLLAGAHFFRDGNTDLAVVSIALPFILFHKKRRNLYILSAILIIIAGEWLATALNLYNFRIEIGAPAERMMLIMSALIIFTFFSASLLLSNRIRERYTDNGIELPIAISFFVTAAIISMAFIKVKFPILLLERFIPGSGWIEVITISWYASFITSKMLDKAKSAVWRKRIWILFSIVFFLQLFLGLIGYDTFLMTGELHLPVPAVIMAGPLFRWELSIMVFLFLGSIILAGPAWCSYLCYFGAIDQVFSEKKKKPKQMPANSQKYRVLILLLVAASALLMNILGVPPIAAAISGLIFGIAGVVVMMIYSKKKGVMTHCTVFCPIGLIAVILGKISPFRMKIDNSCTDCAQCHLACRYNALNMPDIKKRKPNINCTLCGDCIGTCEHSSINYHFFGLSPATSWKIFTVIAVSMHASFLALGRL